MFLHYNLPPHPRRYEKEGRARKVIKAQQLWFAILEAQVGAAAGQMQCMLTGGALLRSRRPCGGLPGGAAAPPGLLFPTARMWRRTTPLCWATPYVLHLTLPHSLPYCPQVETGNPFVLYKDSANRKSNQQNLGTIKSSNLCTGAALGAGGSVPHPVNDNHARCLSTLPSCAASCRDHSVVLPQPNHCPLVI